MASTIGTAYIQIEPTTKGIGKNLQKEMGSAGTEAGKGFNMSLGKIVSAAAVVGVAAKGAQMTKEFVQGAVGAFGNYEQLVGGVETLFKENADVVQKYADEAYKTAGLSANQYMETVTSFSASLLQSLDGDTGAAAEKANQAIIDMSDNANKMGTSMESIQNAYQGFAKQNYTMLDNLKLGYGGTKGEMQRLLQDATALSGVEYDLDSYADIVEAIHVVQDNLGITGTTAKEASTTLQGSLASMKSQWENVKVALSGGGDLGSAIEEFVKTAETALDNFIPVITKSLDSVVPMIEQLLPEIVAKIPGLLQQVLPTLVTAGVSIIKTLAEGIIAAIPVLIPSLLDLVQQITQMLIELAPQLIEVGLQLLLALSLGIAEALPTLMPAIVDVVITIVDYLIQNADLLIAAAAALITGLVKGLIAALPKLIDAGKKMLKASIDGWKMMFSLLGQAASDMITNLKNKIIEKKNAMISAGKTLINSIKEGLVNAWESVKSWFSEKIADLKEKFKSVFSVNLPSWLGGGDSTSSIVAQSLQSYSYLPNANAYYSEPANKIAETSNGYNQTNVSVVLEGDANRLFRVIQAEASRNAMLVGV